MPDHKYTVVISQADQDVLEDAIIDVNQWIQDAVIGKINHSKNNMISARTSILKDDPSITSMPADDDELVVEIKKHKNYKNRVARDADEKRNLK